MHAQTVPIESPANNQQANMLLSMCELLVWAKYYACCAQRYEFSLHSFSPCCIWFSSLHWATSSPVTLYFHSTICLWEIPQITKHLDCCPMCSPHAEKMVCKNWAVLGALWPGPPLPLSWSGFKDKWLPVNQIWHAVQRQAPLVPRHSPTSNKQALQICPTGIKAQQFVT